MNKGNITYFESKRKKYNGLLQWKDLRNENNKKIYAERNYSNRIEFNI